MESARARVGPRAGPEFLVEHAEMVNSFLSAALRLRDFRADSLVRLLSGDQGGILSDELVHFSGLRFVEDGRRRAEFNPGDGDFPVGETDAGVGHGWVIPCGAGASVWVD